MVTSTRVTSPSRRSAQRGGDTLGLGAGEQARPGGDPHGAHDRPPRSSSYPASGSSAWTGTGSSAATIAAMADGSRSNSRCSTVGVAGAVGIGGELLHPHRRRVQQGLHGPAQRPGELVRGGLVQGGQPQAQPLDLGVDDVVGAGPQ